MVFQNRTAAGNLLSELLEQYKNSDSVVLAIPRGGVPVGYEIAKKLNLPLDVILSKKIGHPDNKEFAIGSVSLETAIVDEAKGVPQSYITSEIKRLKSILKEKYALFRGHREPIELLDKNVIIVDDGIATGNTVLACIEMVRKHHPKKVIVAVPVLPADLVYWFKQEADELVYLVDASYFRGVGAFYEDFSQVEDEEVIELMEKSAVIV